jgi:phosphoribosylformylglycinamidine synthase
VDLAVPPTLVAFAAGVAPVAAVRSGAHGRDSGTRGGALLPTRDFPDGSGPDPVFAAFRANVAALRSLSDLGLVRAAYPVLAGGVAASVALMAFGNGTGIEFDASSAAPAAPAGSLLVELDAAAFDARSADARAALERASAWTAVARTVADPVFRMVSPALLLEARIPPRPKSPKPRSPYCAVPSSIPWRRCILRHHRSHRR